MKAREPERQKAGGDDAPGLCLNPWILSDWWALDHSRMIPLSFIGGKKSPWDVMSQGVGYSLSMEVSTLHHVMGNVLGVHHTVITPVCQNSVVQEINCAVTLPKAFSGIASGKRGMG